VLTICLKKDALLNIYVAATDRQAEAVSALVKSKDDSKAFRSAMTATAESRSDAERARVALRKHVKEHGC
jgi:hypothetical protein